MFVPPLECALDFHCPPLNTVKKNVQTLSCSIVLAHLFVVEYPNKFLRNIENVYPLPKFSKIFHGSPILHSTSVRSVPLLWHYTPLQLFHQTYYLIYILGGLYELSIWSYLRVHCRLRRITSSGKNWCTCFFLRVTEVVLNAFWYSHDTIYGGFTLRI